MKFKRAFKDYLIIIIGIIFLSSNSCKKEQKDVATLTTIAITSLTQVSAISGGTIISDGGNPVIARGVCWSTHQTPTIADPKTINGVGTGSYSSYITGIEYNTSYFVRAYVTTNIGTTYGNEISFTTSPATIPILNTSEVSLIAKITAASGGSITGDGGANITSKGICWGFTINPTISDSKIEMGGGTASFVLPIAGLKASTAYYVRAFATNAIGTGYGSAISFTTQSYTILFNPSSTYGTVTDIDGNVYKTIIIGNQTWMAQNLKTTRYNDGANIPLITDHSGWSNLTSPGYCWYNNDAASFRSTYGALYNWYTVNTGKLCITGWHVPTDVEWTTLQNSLGGYDIARGKLKETETSNWLSPNFGATNQSGFTALPGGGRGDNRGTGIQETFFEIGIFGYWWLSTTISQGSSDATIRYLNYNNDYVYVNSSVRQRGYSVRCLKD